ncbi:MAG: endonuclease III [Candidatus Heimdallarchaeota archaeon]|nr:endonuclease III [Candidatus Heimdallarchaeota archaeon]
MKLSEKAEQIISRLQTKYPDSKVSLNFSNPYELLVGTILSAQATDNSVNKVLPALFLRYPNIKSLSEATPDEIKPYIQSIGLFNNKSKFLSEMARFVMENHNGEIPKVMSELIKLPGVGRKTANVVMGNGFGIMDSGITVDTHVIRLSQRMGLTKSTTADKIEKDLMKIIPIENWVSFTPLFIDHGRTICGRSPKCNDCPVFEICDYFLSL